jgi:hypothetical protein
MKIISKKIATASMYIVIFTLLLSGVLSGPSAYAAEEPVKETLENQQIDINRSYTFMPPDDTVPLPEGFEKTLVSIQGKDLPAWSLGGEAGEFYLLFAGNEEGEKTLYQYDVLQETLQRYESHALVVEERFFKAESRDTSEKMSTVLLGNFGALAIVGLLILTIFIMIGILGIMIRKRKKLHKQPF